MVDNFPETGRATSTSHFLPAVGSTYNTSPVLLLVRAIIKKPMNPSCLTADLSTCLTLAVAYYAGACVKTFTQAFTYLPLYVSR